MNNLEETLFKQIRAKCFVFRCGWLKWLQLKLEQAQISHDFAINHFFSIILSMSCIRPECNQSLKK